MIRFGAVFRIAGLFLIILGCTMLIPLVFALGTIIGLHRQILAEERFLANHYGSAYDTYRATVRRYLGRTARQA